MAVSEPLDIVRCLLDVVKDTVKAEFRVLKDLGRPHGRLCEHGTTGHVRDIGLGNEVDQGSGQDYP